MQATVHAALGKWLDKEQSHNQSFLQQSEGDRAALQGHPFLVLWGGRVCLSLGSLLVVMVVSLLNTRHTCLPDRISGTS